MILALIKRKLILEPLSRFFFSSRRRHTRSFGDWSSDVCSSDLRRQPTRLPHPWDSPGKNTGVGCHFLIQCMKVKSESEVAQSCPTLRDPMECSPPVSSVQGIFQARSGLPLPSLLQYLYFPIHVAIVSKLFL